MGNQICLSDRHNNNQPLFGGKFNNDKNITIKFYSTDLYTQNKRRRRKKRNFNKTNNIG